MKDFDLHESFLGLQTFAPCESYLYGALDKRTLLNFDSCTFNIDIKQFLHIFPIRFFFC